MLDEKNRAAIAESIDNFRAFRSWGYPREPRTWLPRLRQDKGHRALVAGFLEAEPDAAGMILFGACSLAHVERRMTASMLDAWARGVTSLRTPLAAPVAA